MTEFINDNLAELEVEPESFHLETDNDGHWYVIRDGEEDEFLQWVFDMEHDEPSDYDFEDARILGHPSMVHFRSFWMVE